MPAAPALGPAHQLEEQAPLVLDAPPRRASPSPVRSSRRRRSGRSPGATSSSPIARLPVAPGAPDLLVVGLDRAGRGRWTTARTSGRSMPMPKALVATTTSSSPLGEGALRPRRAGRRQARRGRRPRASPAAAEPLAARLRSPAASARRRSRAPRAGAAAPQRLGEERVHAARRARARPSTSTARRARFGRAKPRTICGVSAGQAEPRQDLVAHHRRRGGGAGEHARRPAARPGGRRAPGTPAGSRGPTR